MKLFIPAVALILLSGCASYAPPSIDKETGRYSEIVPLEAGAIEKKKTNVDLSKYRFVYLNAETNVYESRFEFFVREALVGFGFKHILNQDELIALVSSDKETTDLASLSDPLAQRKLSNDVGPILYIRFSSRWDGDVRRYVDVEVVDMSSGETLLKINHPKMIWWEVDREAHYPVLNAIKQWTEECGKPGVSA